MPPKLKVYQLESNTVCSPYRLIYPGDAMNRSTDIEVKLFRDFGQRQCDELLREANLFIIQRMEMVPHLRELIDALNHKGILVVYEIDDDMLHLDPESRQAALVSRNSALNIENCIRACQAVQCSTSSLASILARIHPEVAVLENQLDRVPPFKAKPARSGATIVGYAAGGDHGHDWPFVRDAYNRIVAELSSRGAQIETWIVGDPQIYASIASPRKRLFPSMPRGDYLRFLAHVDISIIPLKDGAFNESKSDVKYLESAAMGTPVLASEIVYGRTIVDGETGLLFRNGDEFAAQLLRLVTDSALAARTATAAHAYVKENRVIDRHAAEWASTYLDWHARREALLARSRVAV
jgi:glycosyltransferase involved in cell wall biosynthesis